MMKLKKLAAFHAALFTALFALNSCNNVATGVSSVDSPVSNEISTSSEQFNEATSTYPERDSSIEESAPPETSESAEMSEDPEETPPPLLMLGINTVEISAKNAVWGVTCSFTAEESAVYTLASHDENGLISWKTSSESGCVSAENSVSPFYLEAGETLTLLLSTKNHQANSLSFTLTKSDEDESFALTVGTNNLKVQKSNSEKGVCFAFSSPADGNYAINSWSVGEVGDISITYAIGGGIKYLDGNYALFSLRKGETVIFTVYAQDGAFQYEDFCFVDVNVHTVALANEQTKVAITDGSTPLVFYAKEGGRYEITVTDGAQVMRYSDEVWEWVAITSFEAQANTLIDLTVLSESLTEATVSIVKV